MKKFWIALVLCLLAGTAQAQDYGLSGASSGSGSSAHKHMFYVGVDYQWMTLAVNKSVAGFAKDHYHGRLYDIRVGYRFLPNVGIEVHAGVNGRSDHRSGSFGFSRYYGVFVVPTATMFNTVELSLPIGYAFTGVKQRLSGQPEASDSINSAAFGVNMELPIEDFSAALPNLRLTAGAVVLVQRSDTQIYGFHAGLRYDFGFGSDSSAG